MFFAQIVYRRNCAGCCAQGKEFFEKTQDWRHRFEAKAACHVPGFGDVLFSSRGARVDVFGLPGDVTFFGYFSGEPAAELAVARRGAGEIFHYQRTQRFNRTRKWGFADDIIVLPQGAGSPDALARWLR